jgi:D-xylose 1-dehydrogenase (NADP+, D-xylono-1,5-lactone-forming)
MSEKFKWAILGTGMIARKFAAQLPECPEAELVAVGSRQLDSAAKFTAEFGGEPLGSYDAVIGLPEVDALYLSLPNALHHPWALRALAAGKHVLCEKPMACHAPQAEEMFAAARQADRVLIEAFMYRCHPAVQEVIRLVHGGAIGQLKLIRSNFTFNRPDTIRDFRYQPQEAGGSLMDVGGYCINFARTLAQGEPADLRVLAHLHPSGVDDYAAGVMRFGEHVLATFTCGMTVESDRGTYIGGSDGFIAMDFPWLSNGSFVLNRKGKAEPFHLPGDKGIYALEAEAFMRAVRQQEPPWITPADTLGNLRVMDELRRQIGLVV